MALPETNILSRKTELNTFDQNCVEVLSHIGNLLALPDEVLFSVTENKFSLNPLAANFGRQAQTVIETQIRQTAICQTQQSVNYSVIYAVMADGIGEKIQNRNTAITDAGSVFRALKFYQTMAELLPEKEHGFADLDTEILTINEMITSAVSGLDRNCLIDYGGEKIQLKPGLSLAVKRKMLKRAVLLKTRGILEELDQTNKIVYSLDDLTKVYSGKKEAREHHGKLWELHHIIIPIINTLEEQDGKKYLLKDECLSLARGEAFSKPTKTTGSPKRVASQRLKRRRNRRGMRGPQPK